jgi:hypothetical protein
MIIYILDKEELPQQWKELIFVLIYKKRDNIDFSNYQDMSLLWTTYKGISNTVLQG